MLAAGVFVEAARRHGIGLWTGVPCSFLQPFINYVIGDDSLTYVPASNEGDAVAIAAGSQIGGQLAVAMMQNSGLGNAVNPLTSLAFTHRIPMLLIVTLRGEPGGAADEPQHELMGQITTDLLELMQVEWEWFPDSDDAVEACLARARQTMDASGLPFCLVMRKGAVAPWPAPAVAPAALPQGLGAGDQLPEHCPSSRQQMLAAVQAALQPNDVVLATTGYTGRELYALADRSDQLYLVGAMGCVSSVALGLALARPDLRVIALDGDGAMLMRLGALATIGFMAPPNLLHILLDNGLHESTGGQSTVSRSVHLGAIALACGYAQRYVLNDSAVLAELVRQPTAQLTFIRALTAAGVPDGLPRPAVTPVTVTERLRQHITTLNQDVAQ